jgi:hypothetical protein
MNIWSPHVDPHRPRAGLHPERYALRLEAGPFFGLGPEDGPIREVSHPAQAYQFHTQEGALRVARKESCWWAPDAGEEIALNDEAFNNGAAAPATYTVTADLPKEKQHHGLGRRENQQRSATRRISECSIPRHGN